MRLTARNRGRRPSPFPFRTSKRQGGRPHSFTGAWWMMDSPVDGKRRDIFKKRNICPTSFSSILFFPSCLLPSLSGVCTGPNGLSAIFLHLSACLERPSWEGTACLHPREESRAPSEPSLCLVLEVIDGEVDAGRAPGDLFLGSGQLSASRSPSVSALGSLHLKKHWGSPGKDPGGGGRETASPAQAGT